MYKEYLALNNLQWLICHKTQPNQILFFLLIIIRSDLLAEIRWFIIIIISFNNWKIFCVKSGDMKKKGETVLKIKSRYFSKSITSWEKISYYTRER